MASATSSKRLKLSNDRLEVRIEEFMESDRLSSLADLKVGLSSNDLCIPSGFLMKFDEDSVYLFYIVTENVPIIKASLRIDGDLTVAVFVDDHAIPEDNYSDIAANSTVSSISQVLNLMSRAKHLSYSSDICIDEVIGKLEQWRSASQSDQLSESLNFLIEQVLILNKSKFARSYSSQLMVMTYQIHAASPAAYDFLYQQKILCLPSVCTLKKLTRKLSTDSGLQIENYLRLRTAKLDGRDCNVLLMIDEVYLFKRIEYSGNQVHGITEHG